jgi:integrase
VHAHRDVHFSCGTRVEFGPIRARLEARALSPSELTNVYHRRVLKQAGLERIRDLRRTTATILLGRGAHPKIVSEMLGHTSIAITLDFYSHVIPTMQRDAAAAFDAVIGATA